MRQSELAAAVGISASYLNLIEHDKRRIGGRLLGQIAEALNIPTGLLVEGAERGVLDAMREAAASAETAVEIARAEDLAARFPGWARLISEQGGRIGQLETRVQMLHDRVSYDPALATALHEMISAVTAIRSTAGILNSDEGLDDDWRRRFHRNIHNDAMKLAEESEALIRYLEPPDAASDVPLSPLEEVESLLDETSWSLDETTLDSARARLRPMARDTFTSRTNRIRSDAEVFPDVEVMRTVEAHGIAPWSIAAALGLDLALVMRRLATMPVEADLPPLGLVVCDAGGFPLWLKEVEGFSFPRGAACPLWPIYVALGQPGRPVEADVVLPDQTSTRLHCTAIAEPVPGEAPGAPPHMIATMLACPNPAQEQPRPWPVGVSCRICPREACSARREPSVMDRPAMHFDSGDVTGS